MERVIISVKQEIQRLWLGPVMSPKKNEAWFPPGHTDNRSQTPRNHQNPRQCVGVSSLLLYYKLKLRRPMHVKTMPTRSRPRSLSAFSRRDSLCICRQGGQRG